eukprot:6460894-Amphidinium_carterae.1
MHSLLGRSGWVMSAGHVVVVEPPERLRVQAHCFACRETSVPKTPQPCKLYNALKFTHRLDIIQEQSESAKLDHSCHVHNTLVLMNPTKQWMNTEYFGSGL